MSEQTQMNLNQHSVLYYFIKKRLSLITTSIFLFSFSICFSQQTDSIIESKGQRPYYPLRLSVFPAGFIPTDLDIEKNYSEELFKIHPIKTGVVPVNRVNDKIISRFSITNKEPFIDSFYFFPSFFFQNVILYELKNGTITPLPLITPDSRDSISFRLFVLAPNDTITIVTESYSQKTYTTTFLPRIINANYLKTFTAEFAQSNNGITKVTFVICGLLLMMILFSLANYLQGRNKEFLYYAGYAFFLGLMFLTKQLYYGRSNHINYFFETYMDFILQSIGICFFIIFMIKFLETKKYFPFLHKVYLSGLIFLPIVMIVYSIIHFSDIDYYWENFVENVLAKNVLLFLMILLLIYSIINWKHKLLRYLFWGNALYLCFGLISLLLILNRNIIRLPGIFRDALIYYELGILAELIFFLMGLTYKNRKQLIEQIQERERLKTENERKELEKQVAVMQAHQEEREKISADIHDELGSGMTTIRLMSELAKKKLKENVPVEIEKISNSANEVLNKMNAIVWSMNSSNDSLDSLISYIRAYAIEFFDGTPIDCKVLMPSVIPPQELSGDKRRNIFLCVKETLNNVLKHSKASNLKIDIETNDNLIFIIKDDGIGIEMDKIRRFGNGLKNIERRMKSIGGTYNITDDNGTETILALPL